MVAGLGAWELTLLPVASVPLLCLCCLCVVSPACGSRMMLAHTCLSQVKRVWEAL